MIVILWNDGDMNHIVSVSKPDQNRMRVDLVCQLENINERNLTQTVPATRGAMSAEGITDKSRVEQPILSQLYRNTALTVATLSSHSRTERESVEDSVSAKIFGYNCAEAFRSYPLCGGHVLDCAVDS